VQDKRLNGHPEKTLRYPAHAGKLMTRQKYWWTAPLFALLSACGGSSNEPDPYALMEGEQIYRVECAGCHGLNLEGQPDWRTRRADRKLPAPPHDESGHTWHHSMEQLVAITKFGMVPPNPPEGYVSDMPAFEGKLSDKQIKNVLIYIENQWSPEIRARRDSMLQQK
jgi:mono/diheme cytochrome c family protein